MGVIKVFEEVVEFLGPHIVCVVTEVRGVLYVVLRVHPEFLKLHPRFPRLHFFNAKKEEGNKFLQK